MAAPYTQKQHPQAAAHSKVYTAVKEGRLVRPKACSACNRKAKRIEGHHDDYNRPLDVRWLCRQCHDAHHRDTNTGRWANPDYNRRIMAK